MIHEIFTYKELSEWSSAFVGGSFGLLFLVGDPGHAKSFTLRKLLNEETVRKEKKTASKKKVDTTYMPVTGQMRPMDHQAQPLWIEGGNVSAFKLFQKTYQHLDETIILDDVDSVYSDRTLVRLLKSICQTETIKEISWTTQSKQLDAAGIPDKYKCCSRVGIIANHWKSLNQHVGSLLSRGVMLEFKPSIEEVYKYITKNKIIADPEILSFAKKNLWLAQKIDIRDFKISQEAKAAKLTWKPALSMSLGIRETLLIHEMDSSGKYNTDEEKASNFMRETRMSRPMYWKYKTKLNEIKENAKISSNSDYYGETA